MRLDGVGGWGEIENEVLPFPFSSSCGSYYLNT